MPRYSAVERLPHFCTLTVKDWIPVFIEERYIDPILTSLQFCREQKGLRLYAYVLMPNHLHLIGAAEDDLHPLMRDFKRFTSRTVHDRLKEDGRVSLLKWFEIAKEPARQDHGEFSFWRPGFHPQAIYTEEVFAQKLEYLHNNPVRKELVEHPAHWRYSSASYFEGRPDVLMELDKIEEWE